MDTQKRNRSSVLTPLSSYILSKWMIYTHVQFICFSSIFIDFSFVKQKQEIEEQARILKEQAKAASSKNVWPQFNKPN